MFHVGIRAKVGTRVDWLTVWIIHAPATEWVFKIRVDKRVAS